MKFTSPRVELINEPDLLRKIERCYRICYKSEDKMKETSDEFLTKMINFNPENPHWSPLEHARIEIIASSGFGFDLLMSMESMRKHFIDVEMFADESDSMHKDLCKITGNFRAFKDVIAYFDNELKDLEDKEDYKYDFALRYFLNESLANYYPVIFPHMEKSDYYDDNMGDWAVYDIKQATDYYTFKIITSRDILQEFARHRTLSFSVESTRYCNYTKREFEVIIPKEFKWSTGIKADYPIEASKSYAEQQWIGDDIKEDKEQALTFINSVEQSYNAYKTLIESGATPQQARGVLPGCTKTEFYVTGTKSAWEHFLKLRDDKAAHPAIQYLAKQIKSKIENKEK